MKYEAVVGGLRVAKIPGGYAVLHEGSGLPAVQYLRQRRFAEQARDELLATGVDFTQDKRIVSSGEVRQRWEGVFHRWRARTHAQGEKLQDLDPETFEYYPEGTRYGQFTPSAAQAAEMRELAARLREAGRTPVSEVALSAYINEFARMGLVVRDDDELIWAGAAA